MTRKFVLWLSLGLVLRLLLSFLFYSGDVNNHMAWGDYALTHGFAHIYDFDFVTHQNRSQVNYPPLPLYAFALGSWVQATLPPVVWWLNTHLSVFPSVLVFWLQDPDAIASHYKVPFILGDLLLSLGIYYLARLFLSRPKSWTVFLLILFNPALIYVSALWGQIDSLPLAFLAFSFYFLFRHRANLSLSLLVLALLSKQTIAPILPLYLWAAVHLLSFRRLVEGYLTAIVVFYILFLPFLQINPFSTYASRVLLGFASSVTTDQAFNLWAILTPSFHTSDARADVLGWILVLVIYWRLLIRASRHTFSPQLFLSTVSGVFLATFLFLTRMHERHILPALVFLTFTRKRWLWLGLNLLVLCNLYHNLRFPSTPILPLIDLPLVYMCLSGLSIISFLLIQ